MRALVTSRVPPPVRFALRQLALELRIARIHRASSRKARRLGADGVLISVNMASGFHPKRGWINVDLFAPDADFRLDLRRPLPFRDGSARYVYAEHFFEHLEFPNLLDSLGWELEGPRTVSPALQFLRECRRILAPGGTLDIVVPDAEGMIGEYVSRRAVGPAEWWGPAWCDTWMHRLNYLFRQGREHKYAYDAETLAQLFHHAGFCNAKRRSFDPQMDAPNHAIGSLCMTATKISDQPPGPSTTQQSPGPNDRAPA
jgi:predicted SAM-dependent methyltransferase